MRKFFKKSSKKAGLPPGSLIHIGDAKKEDVKITLIDFDETSFEEKQAASARECFEFKEKPTVTWINVDGVHAPEIIEKLGECYGIHPLVQEDILNTGQRPKAEDYSGHLFVVLNMLRFDDHAQETRAEQVSLILGPNFVISFQEQEGDVFDAVRERLRTAKGRIRKMGADYLAYALLDAVVDNYFVILEKLSEKVEVMEEELVSNPTPATMQTIHSLKREMIFLRKSVWPLREVVSLLQRGETPLVKESTHVYLRDVYDHTIQVIDTVETLRDMISGMLDIYLSSVSNRMNEVMKVLTIIATIFIPLTFIAGIYGMNFEHMPELKWAWAYPFVWFVMVAVAVLMLIFFRKRRWL